MMLQKKKKPVLSILLAKLQDSVYVPLCLSFFPSIHTCVHTYLKNTLSRFGGN